MSAYQKLTKPDPNDPTEVTIADGWNALAKVEGSDDRMDLLALRQPLSDALIELQYRNKQRKELEILVRSRLEELAGHCENSTEEGECKAYADLLEKLTGKPA